MYAIKINEYFVSFLPKFQYRFRQRFSAQYQWSINIGKIIEDNKGVFAVVPTDLSKSFDCIPHGLPIAKLNVLGFDKKSLFFISACLNKQKQKPNSGSVFSDFLNVLFGVPQGLILGPILFIIFIADLFLLTMTSFLSVMYMIPLPTLADRIFLENVISLKYSNSFSKTV